MYGIYLFLKPAFALVLILATTAALYMGIFKAHHAGRGFGFKALSGALSGAISLGFWSVFYSYQYLGW